MLTTGLILGGALVLVAGALIIGLTIRGRHAPATETNCAKSPAACGYPAKSTTGVPGTMKLKKVPGQVKSGTGWHYDPRGWVEVDGDGAVLKGLYIPYNVDVTASNVTIQDVKVVTGGGDALGVSLRHTSDVTVEDSTIQGTNATSGRVMAGVKDVYGDSTGTLVLRDNIYNYQTGVQMDEGLIQDNYITQSGIHRGRSH